MEGRSKNNEMIKHGEKITYGCLRNYKMIGSKTQECDNGRWTSDAPVCKGRLIKSLSAILTLNSIHTLIRHMFLRVYTCTSTILLQICVHDCYYS